MSSKAQQQKDKATILKLTKAWSKALEKRDLDTMLAGYHKNIHLFDITPPYQTVGIKAYRKLWEESFAHFPEKFKSTHRNIKISVDGNTAFLHCLHRLEAIAPSTAQEMSWIRATICFQKIDRKWLVTHEHISIPGDMATGTIAFIKNP